MSPVLAGRFLTTAPPGKSLVIHFKYSGVYMSNVRAIKSDFCYVHVVTFGEPLGNLGMGAGFPQNQSCN